MNSLFVLDSIKFKTFLKVLKLNSTNKCNASKNIFVNTDTSYSRL